MAPLSGRSEGASTGRVWFKETIGWSRIIPGTLFGWKDDNIRQKNTHTMLRCQMGASTPSDTWL